MLVDKEAKIANFNLIVGSEEEPMLDYFDTLIYPAFISGIKRTDKENEYLFKDVKVETSNDGKYVLVGKIVKKTFLEVKSDIDEEGRLIEKDEKYSAAPYSTFVIYLNNHRMALIPNQKGSPLLPAFRSTTYHILNEYRKRINDKKDEADQIPQFDLTVVGIPNVQSIKDALANVEKITELILRFYPLNGDLEFEGLFGPMTTDLRRTVGSKRGEIKLRSPKNINGIETVIEKSAGTVEPIINAKTRNNTSIRISNTDISEKHNIKIEENGDIQKETNDIIEETSKISSIQYTSDEHEKIYSRNKAKILKFVIKP